MADNIIDVSDKFDSPRKLIRLINTNEGESEDKYAIATVNIGHLIPEVYDYISLSYTGDNITGVVYKTGGSGGTTVATLTIAYSGSNITSITRT